MSRTIKVLLVDEQKICRVGVVRILEDHSDIIVVGEVDTGRQTLQHIEQSTPDVVILDIDIDDLNGIDVISHIKKMGTGIKVIVFTRHESELYVSRCFDAGANAYLSKRCGPEELSVAINEVVQDGTYLSNDISRRIALNKISNEERTVMSLTSREFTVFRCLAQGKSMVEIADKLHISPKTGYVFRSRIFEKLKTKNIIKLTELAHRHQVI